MDTLNQPQSPQPAVEKNSIPPKPPVDSKTLLIAVIVFIVIMIGLITYVLAARTKLTSQPPTISPTLSQPSPTPDETANWKTYAGQSFSFQYPEDWSIVKTDNSSVRLQKEERWEKQGAYPAQTVKASILVEGINISKDITLDKWLETRYLRGKDTNLFEITKEGMTQTTLGSIDAIAVKVPGGAGYIDEGTVAIYKKRGYDVSVIGVEIKGAREAYQTVVKTFKFLEQETSNLRVCPDNWVEFLSPIPVINNPYYGQKGQFITINGSIDLIPVKKFDLEWIKQNCKVKEPEPVG